MKSQKALTLIEDHKNKKASKVAFYQTDGRRWKFKFEDWDFKEISDVVLVATKINGFELVYLILSETTTIKFS